MTARWRSRADLWLNVAGPLAMVAVIAGIQTAALAMQYGRGELPCPLCLLERVAIFGVALGALLNFRGGFSWRYVGLSLSFTVLLLVIAARQTLLDIYPRPGHEYVGSAVLGLHMPVWSVAIALVLLIVIALRMLVLGDDRGLIGSDARRFPRLARIANVLFAIIMLLAAINLVSAFLQCGFDQCHTYGYRLLGGPTSPPDGG